jgi:hypothetical protein
MLDNATGNQKPIFANSNNKNMLAATVFGVSVTERANATGALTGAQHAGWNIVKRGTGGIATVTISNPGTGINANGFLSVTSVGGAANTVNANIAYYVSSNANSSLNVVTSVVIVHPGLGYTSAPTVIYNGSNTIRPTFTITMGGKVGRIMSETLVAAGSITGDDPADDSLFPGT